jgi:hypothetical protein
MASARGVGAAEAREARAKVKRAMVESMLGEGKVLKGESIGLGWCKELLWWW